MKDSKLILRISGLIALLIIAGCTVPNTKLHEATEEGNIAKVDSLLQKYSSLVNTPDQAGNTPLHIAAKEGYLEICSLLIKNEADVNAKEADHLFGRTPLHKAARYGHPETCELLLAAGADINAAAKDGSTPLHKAAFWANAAICSLLLEHDADPNAQNIAGQTPLHMPAMKYWQVIEDFDVIQLLLRHGANPQARDKDNQTPLQVALKNDKQQIVEIIIAHRADSEAN